MEQVRIRISREPHGRGLELPRYMTAAAAGMDLRAAVTDAIVIGPGHRCLVPCGIRLELPAGHEGQVRPRSGLALASGLTVLNSPGTIDADYRGEVKVILINLGLEPVTVKRGDRVAQLVIAPVVRAEVIESEELGPTARDAGGFGHTGR